MSFIGAAIGIGTTLVGAAVSGSAAKGAAKTQAQAASQATAEQQRQYDISRGDLSSYRIAGNSAIDELAGLLGIAAPGVVEDPLASKRQELKAQIDQLTYKSGYLGAPASVAAIKQQIATLQKEYDALPPPPLPGTTTGAKTGASDIMAKLEATPGFKFRLAEGQKGTERASASRTGTLSGAATKAMSEYNQNFASNEYQASVDRLMNLSTLGENAAAQTAQLGANKANQVGSNIIGAGNAIAAGQVGSANAWSNAIGGIGSNLSNIMMLKELNKTGYKPTIEA